MVRQWRGVVAVGLAMALAGCGQGVGLTGEQEQAVESVTRLTKFLAGTAGSFSEITRLDNLLGLLAGQIFNSGNCPRLTARQQGIGLAVDFDYTGGCGNSPLAGGRAVSGALNLGFDLLQFQGTLGFNQFALAGHPVNGSIGLRPIDKRFGQMRILLNQLQIGEVGTLSGESGLVFSTDGSMAMRDGQIQMRDLLNTEFGVKLSELAFDPGRFGNPLPFAGQVAFVVPLKLLAIDSVELRVGFSEETPRNGMVSVGVGPLGPFRYKLLHFSE